MCSEFLHPEKNPSTSVGFEPANLGSRGEYVTPRPPRPTRLLRHACATVGLFFNPGHHTGSLLRLVCYDMVFIKCIFSFQAQFALNVLHTLPLLFLREVKYPRSLALVILSQNFTMLLLFYDFYRKAYLKKKIK